MEVAGSEGEVARHHGPPLLCYVFGERQFGNLEEVALKTKDKKIHAGPPEFLARTRELMAMPRRRRRWSTRSSSGNRRKPATR